MKRSTPILIATLSLSILYTLPVSAIKASEPFIQQEQLNQARQLEQWKKDRAVLPRIKVEKAAIEKETQDISPSMAAFYVDEIHLEGLPEELDFLNDKVHAYEKQKLSMNDIEKLVRILNQKLQDKGYVTTQVVIPEQNISAGTLHLLCLPGRLHQVIYSQGSKKLPWQNAFPIRDGDLLNLRMLEEGLENMKRVSSQEVSMKILPTAKAGYSDLELTVQQGKQVHGMLSLDDSGMKETGKYQWNAGIVFDDVFHANDTLQLSAVLDGSRRGSEKGSRYQSFSYTIPKGKDRLTISHNRSRYHQTVAGIPYDFISSGKTQTTRFTYDHMISRSQSERKALDISMIKRDSHYFINDMEIPVQAMDTTALEVGLSDRIYIGRNTLYVRLGHKQGTGWMGAKKENTYPDSPKTRYQMWLFDIDWQQPFTMGHRQASFSSSLHGQWNTKGNRLYGVDALSIGNRYTVRGFDGEYTLMGESGWYLRNELSSNIPTLHSDIYLGLDVGSVYGVSTDVLVGRTIAGMALGLRGNFSSGLSYDALISHSLYKPEGYHTRKWVPGFTVSWKF